MPRLEVMSVRLESEPFYFVTEKANIIFCLFSFSIFHRRLTEMVTDNEGTMVFEDGSKCSNSLLYSFGKDVYCSSNTFSHRIFFFMTKK
jgi:hypothetical protein